MKKILFAAVAAGLVALTGCKPTPEQINQTASAIGYAAGLVANETGIKDDARNAVVAILNEVRACVPAEGQSFEDAWTPVIKAKVAELVAAGKLDEATGALVTSCAVIAAKGVDYLFDVRYPEAKQYAELVAAGASGAIDGFLAAFKPVDGKALAGTANGNVEYDKAAYEFLKKSAK